jgi:ABC-type transport system substrate-binding protein
VNALPNSILNGLWLNPERPNVTALQPILSMCIDRTYINSKTNYKLAFPTDSIFEIQQSSEGYGYSLETAAQKLDEMGWVDDDGDLETPRVAQGVTSVEDGTPLILSMVIPDDPLYDRESTAIQASLQECGIQLNIKTVNTWDYLTQDGPVFSLDFDLMPFSHVITEDFPCSYLDEEWVASTMPGVEKVEQISQLCSAIRSDRTVSLDEEEMIEIENALPLIPLFYRADVSIARADMCGFTPTVGSSSDLWNLEEFNYGETCPQ